MSEESEVLKVLQQVEELLRILVKTQLGEIVAKEMSDPQKKRLYDLTGGYTARELVKKVDLSLASISRIWQKWEQMGLIVKDGKRYRKVA